MAAKHRRENEAKHSDRRRRRKEVVEVSWEDAGHDAIAWVIRLAERLDGAVRFGRSRDRAVLSVGWYVGDDRFTEWLPRDGDPDTALYSMCREISEDYDIAVEDV